jgi:ComF family protein
VRDSDLLSAVADLLWPGRCASCRALLARTAGGGLLRVLCPLCADAAVEVEPPACARCGLPFPGAGEDHLCAACLADPPGFARARARYVWGGPLADAVVRFKYRDCPHLAGPLGALLDPLVLGAAMPDLIVPVPLHPRRLRSRGYNQSALLARRVSLATGAPLVTKLLERTVETHSQAGLSRRERMRNLEGAFAVRAAGRWQGARALLVDDVVTTTATIRVCSAALAKAGIGEVEVISLARVAMLAR